MTLTDDYPVVVDSFVDAGLECREQGVLPLAISKLAETGALDDLLRVEWVKPVGLDRGSKPKRGRGCSLGLWRIALDVLTHRHREGRR